MRMWRAMVSAVGTAARVIAAAHQELLFFAGVVLLAVGAWWVYPPAGLMTAGGLLVWIAIPTRHFPVVFRAPKEPK